MTERRALRRATHIALLILGALYLLPVIWVLLSSLKPGSELFSWPPRIIARRPTLDNYRLALAQGDFALYFANTAIVTVTSTALTVLINAMSGYAFAKYRFRGRNLIFVSFLVTLILPLEVIMIPIFRVVRFFGLYNSLLGVVIPPAATPTGVFVARQFFMTVPDELLEAARIDGAGETRIFTHLMLPIARPILSVLAIFSFMWRWNDYMWPLLVLRDPKRFTVQLALANFAGQYSVDWTSLLSMSVLSMLPVLAVFLIFQKQFVRGMISSGLKA